MKRTPAIFDKIEAYLSQSLPKEEIEMFEKEIANNTDLYKEVEKHKALHDILKDKETMAFKEKLTAIGNKINPKENKTPSNLLFLSGWKIAATLVILLGIGSILWHNMLNQDITQELYASYYKPFPVEDVTRGESNTKHKDIIKKYTNNEYKNVIALLENKSDLNDEFVLYLGNSYINTNQEKKAILTFEKIEKNSKYYENAKWYLSLTYLKLEETEQTLSLLEEIIQYNGIYRNPAMNLKS